MARLEAEVFGPLGRRMRALLGRYSDVQLQTICDYLDSTADAIGSAAPVGIRTPTRPTPTRSEAPFAVRGGRCDREAERAACPRQAGPCPLGRPGRARSAGRAVPARQAGRQAPATVVPDPLRYDTSAPARGGR